MTDEASLAPDDEKASATGELDHHPVSGAARAPRDRQQSYAWLVGAAVAILLLGWLILFSPGESGSRAQWFFGAAVFAMVLVTLWQTTVVTRQAARTAADAAERLRAEVAAADVRAARQLALMRSLHETEMEAQRELSRAELEAHRNVARAELEAHRELARTERAQLLSQQQKLAIAEVSRAVGTHTKLLGALWNEGARILRIPDRDEREAAMAPIFEQIAQVVKDFAVELANAQVLIADDRLHRALIRVNEAVLAAMQVAEDIHVSVVDGEQLDSNPVPAAQRLLYERAAETRHLAWELLRTSLE